MKFEELVTIAGQDEGSEMLNGTWRRMMPQQVMKIMIGFYDERNLGVSDSYVERVLLPIGMYLKYRAEVLKTEGGPEMSFAWCLSGEGVKSDTIRTVIAESFPDALIERLRDADFGPFRTDEYLRAMKGTFVGEMDKGYVGLLVSALLEGAGRPALFVKHEGHLFRSISSLIRKGASVYLEEPELRTWFSVFSELDPRWDVHDIRRNGKACIGEHDSVFCNLIGTKADKKAGRRSGIDLLAGALEAVSPEGKGVVLMSTSLLSEENPMTEMLFGGHRVSAVIELPCHKNMGMSGSMRNAVLVITGKGKESGEVRMLDAREMFMLSMGESMHAAADMMNALIETVSVSVDELNERKAFLPSSFNVH